MRKLFSKLWADDRGFIISTEMLFVTVILVIGLVAGWASLRNALNAQYTSLAQDIAALDLEYSFGTVSGAGLAGSSGGTTTSFAYAPNGTALTAAAAAAPVGVAASVSAPATALVP